jgi:hypothetical protein
MPKKGLKSERGDHIILCEVPEAQPASGGEPEISSDGAEIRSCGAEIRSAGAEIRLERATLVHRSPPAY